MLLNPSNLHHAYICIGSAEETERVLAKLFSLKGSPDFFVWKESVFGIDDARELSIWAIRRDFTGRKIFLIAPGKITLQAQNALLKTFEEPIANTHFFLVVRDEGVIIPTLRSRCQVLFVKHSVFDMGEAEKFLKMSLKKRLEFAKSFAEKEKNLPVFLDELLRLKRSEILYKMRLLSDARSVSSRLVLEHLAIVL